MRRFSFNEDLGSCLEPSLSGASMTLVGLLPPLCDNGNLLVDGGYSKFGDLAYHIHLFDSMLYQSIIFQLSLIRLISFGPPIVCAIGLRNVCNGHKRCLCVRCWLSKSSARAGCFAVFTLYM